MITGPATTFTDLLDDTNLAVHASGTSATVGDELIEAASAAELRSHLSASIYTHLHIRHPGIEAQMHTIAQHDLAARLSAAVPYRQIVQAVTGADAPTHPGPLLHTVTVDGLKVIVGTDHLVRDDHGTILGARFPSWRTRATPGYVLALGQRTIAAAPIARLYLARDTAEHALALWNPLLRRLHQADIAYQAKALSSTAAYPRADALVVYTAEQDIIAAYEATARAIADAPPAAVPTSVFTRLLSPGIATADEPVDPRPAYRHLSFGQHRSRVLADALIRAATHQRRVAETWDEEARAALIDPHEPGRNLTR